MSVDGTRPLEQGAHTALPESSVPALSAVEGEFVAVEQDDALPRHDP